MKPKTEVRHLDAVNDIVTDFRSQKLEKEFLKQETEIKNTRSYRRKRMLRIVSVLTLCLSLLYTAAVISIEMYRIKRREVFAYGLKTGNEIKLNGCLKNMWRLRGAIDEYYYSYGRLPVDLGQLYESKVIAVVPLCPLSEKPYQLVAKKNGKIFLCPNPHEHGVEKIWSYLAGGPPVIEREKEVGDEL